MDSPLETKLARVFTGEINTARYSKQRIFGNTTFVAYVTRITSLIRRSLARGFQIFTKRNRRPISCASLDSNAPCPYDSNAQSNQSESQSSPGGMLLFRAIYAKPLLAGLVLISLVNCRTTNKTMTNKSQPGLATDALSIHRRAIIVDMHADTTQRLVDENVDLQQRLSDGHLDAVRAQEGGLDAQFFSIWVDPDLFGGGGASAMRRADIQIEAVRNLAAKHPETWEVATTAADIRRIAAGGKIAALMGLEGGYAIDNKIENVER
ncbi:MAG TPA: membrane dipeptidase, partial [Chthoniobacterales bacterium]